MSMWSPLSRFLWRNNSHFVGDWACHCYAVIFELTQTFPLSTVNAKSAIRWWSILPTHQLSVEVRSFGLHVLLTWTQWGCIKANIYTMQSKLATTWSNPGCSERHWKQTGTTDSGKALYSILQCSVRVSWREGTSSLVVKKEAEMCASPHYAIRHVCWTYRKSETEKLL